MLVTKYSKAIQDEIRAFPTTTVGETVIEILQEKIRITMLSLQTASTPSEVARLQGKVAGLTEVLSELFLKSSIAVVVTKKEYKEE